MRALLIDPYEQKISETEVQKNEFKYIRALLGCDYLDFFYRIPGHMLIINDMGLMEVNKYFMIRTYSEPLAGKALLVGFVPPDGDMGPATMSLEELQTNLKFLGPETKFLGMRTITEEGPPFVIRNEAQWEGIPKWKGTDK